MDCWGRVLIKLQLGDSIYYGCWLVSGGAAAGFLIGIVAQKVAAYAKCSVLVVKYTPFQCVCVNLRADVRRVALKDAFIDLK